MSGAVTRSASRRRFDVNAIRVPSGDQAGASSATGPSVRRDASPGRDVDQPQVLDPVVDEPGAVEHVVEPVDEPVVGRRRRPGLARPVEPAALEVGVARRPVRGRRHDEPRCRRATTRSRRRRAAGRSGGAPRRRRAAAGRPAGCPRGPSASLGRVGSSSTSVRRSERNASVRPSGENRGWRSCRAPSVSWRGAGPSASVETSHSARAVAVVRRARRSGA